MSTSFQKNDIIFGTFEDILQDNILENSEQFHTIEMKINIPLCAGL